MSPYFTSTPRHNQLHTNTNCVLCDKEILTISWSLCTECELNMMHLLNDNKEVQRYLKKLIKLNGI